MLPHADNIRPLIAMVNPVSICPYLLNISSSRHSVTGIALRPSKGSSDSANMQRGSFFFKLGHLRIFAAAVHNMKIMRRLTPEQQQQQQKKTCGE